MTNKDKDLKTNIIAVSKTFSINDIKPLINHGHIHFGENKVQEAQEKWQEIKKINVNIHQFMKIYANLCKCMKINDNHWKCYEVFENF